MTDYADTSIGTLTKDFPTLDHKIELSRIFLKLDKMDSFIYIANDPDYYDCRMFKVNYDPILKLYSERASLKEKSILKCIPSHYDVMVFAQNPPEGPGLYIEEDSFYLLFTILTKAIERLDPGISEFNEYFIRWLISDSYDIDDIPPFKQYRQAFS